VVFVAATLDTKSRMGCILLLLQIPRSASLISVGSPLWVIGLSVEPYEPECTGLQGGCHEFTHLVDPSFQALGTPPPLDVYLAL
jgi:hypothetical protein